MTIDENLARLSANRAACVQSFRSKGLSVAESCRSDEFPELIDILPVAFSGNPNEHVDEFGIWHKPDDWDDIESVPIEEGKSEVYVLFANHVGNGHSFCRLRVYGSGTIQWARGHSASGVFTPSTSYTTISSGGFIRIDLEQLEDDYSVIHVKASNYLTSCYTAAWDGANEGFSVMHNTCLMRYGRMPKGTNASFQSFYLESDNILDFAKGISGTALSLANAYSSNRRMARWRSEGWNIADNYTTNLSGIFNGCLALGDTYSLNFDGWCSDRTTTCANMFNSCNALFGAISVKNWDVSAVTSFAYMFYACFSITNVIGLDTWNEARECTSVAYMFYNTRGLVCNIDLSSAAFGKSGKLTAANSMFYMSGVMSVNLDTCDFSNVTSFASMFYQCPHIRSVKLNAVGTSATTLSQMFYVCYKLQSVEIGSLDLSGITSPITTGLQYFVSSCYSLKEFKVGRVIRGLTGKTFNDTSTTYGYLFNANYYLKKLDASWIDASVFTSTYFHRYAFTSLPLLYDFYPPTNISKSFYISDSPMLSHESLLRILNNLVDHTNDSGTFTLTIGSINKAKLTAQEQAIATSKKWAIA